MAKKNKSRGGAATPPPTGNPLSDGSNNSVPPDEGKPLPPIGYNQDIEDLLKLHDDRCENGEWVSFYENRFDEECPSCNAEALRLSEWSRAYGFLLENEDGVGKALAFDDSTLRVIRFWNRLLGWGAIYACSKCDVHGIHLSGPQPEEGSE
ncbi:hypothetical protein [Rhizobium sp. IY2]|uniref:hypothetical protein n=1 Tax=Rhizobium sp. IY2 TaxID=3397853 RepID=UPI0039E03D84